MTKEEQIDNARSNCCVVCGSREVEYGSFDPDGSVAIQMAECHDCGSEWSEVFAIKDVVIHKQGTPEQA